MDSSNKNMEFWSRDLLKMLKTCWSNGVWTFYDLWCYETSALIFLSWCLSSGFSFFCFCCLFLWCCWLLSSSCSFFCFCCPFGWFQRWSRTGFWKVERDSNSTDLVRWRSQRLKLYLGRGFPTEPCLTSRLRPITVKPLKSTLWLVRSPMIHVRSQ